MFIPSDKYAFSMYLISPKISNRRGTEKVKKMKSSCWLSLSETKKISTETSGGGLSNLFAYLYKQQFSIFLSRLQRESSHVFVAVIWIVVQWNFLLRSLVVYHCDLEMWFSFSPVFSQSIRKINEIYLPRNFTRNLFILYFYLLSFSAVFPSFASSEWA